MAKMCSFFSQHRENLSALVPERQITKSTKRGINLNIEAIFKTSNGGMDGHHAGAYPDGHQHGVSIEISINLGKTFLCISCIRKMAST